MGNKINTVIDTGIDNNVRKHPTQKRNTMVNQNLHDKLIDTDSSLYSIDSFSTKYFFSSEWQINSVSDNSTLKHKNPY